MEAFPSLIELFLHLDKYLALIVSQYGTTTYTILFLIVFCETGLVVTPFLPGDSLLFAAGAIAATGALDPILLCIILFVAAVLGDAVNYWIGSRLGLKVFEGNSRFFRRAYLERTQRFYEKYGGKTIIIARFVPIVRTFAPFLAGVGTMNYSKFALYNVTGAVLWVVGFIWAGFFFGSIPFVKNNFSVVILAIIILSIMPAVIEVLRARRQPT